MTLAFKIIFSRLSITQCHRSHTHTYTIFFFDIQQNLSQKMYSIEIVLTISSGAVPLHNHSWWKSITQRNVVPLVAPFILSLKLKFQHWVNYIDRTCCGWNRFWFTTFAESLEYDGGEYIDCCWLYWACVKTDWAGRAGCTCDQFAECWYCCCWWPCVCAGGVGGLLAIEMPPENAAVQVDGFALCGAGK